MPMKKAKVKPTKGKDVAHQRKIQFYFKNSNTESQNDDIIILTETSHSNSESSSKNSQSDEPQIAPVISESLNGATEDQPNNEISLKTELKMKSKSQMSGDKEKQILNETLNNGNVDDDQLDDSKTPYYLENFNFILKTVMDDDENKVLFNAEDMGIISSFHNLSVPAQKLYVRLFSRKQKWHRFTGLKYQNISDNLSSVLDELEGINLIDDEQSLTDLLTALELLSVGEVKDFAKELNIAASSKNKKEIIKNVLEYSKKQKSIFANKIDLKDIILKKCKKRLEKCWKVSKEQRKIFLRILFIFSLVQCNEDDDEINWTQNPMLMMLLVNIGKATFPNYEIRKETAIFSSREELISYTEALQTESDILNAIERKDWTSGKTLCDNVFNKMSDNTFQPLERKKKFMHRFTAHHIYCRCISHEVDILQKIKEYNGAVEKLQWLIHQKVFSFKSRGRWYDRLALNLDQHLKDEEKAVAVIKDGLLQQDLRKHSKLTLSIRGTRIKNSSVAKKKNINHLFDDIDLFNVPESTNITIQGSLLPRFADGLNTVFIRKNNSCNESHHDDFVVCSVEQVALDYYLDNGYNDGIHGEGSTFVTIYALLFWNIIYGNNVMDVFRVPYQAYPLDLNSDCFYESRKEEIDNHLDWIQTANIKDIEKLIQENWIAHQDTVSLVKWERFDDIEHLMSLVKCMSGKTLHCIFNKLAKDYRTYRSGFPDLVVWNAQTKSMKIVEVKGPGDRLSTKQMIWLDELKKAKVPCEVCYVQGTSSKKLKKRKIDECE